MVVDLVVCGSLFLLFSSAAVAAEITIPAVITAVAGAAAADIRF